MYGGLYLTHSICQILWRNISYRTSVSLLQSNWHEGRVDIRETTPSAPVTIVPTVPISCPPCRVTLRIVNPLGLTVSTCSLTFTYSDAPMSNHTINIRAVPTLGSNSRTTQLQFRPVETFVSGSGWDNYIMKPVDVSNSVPVVRRQ